MNGGGLPAMAAAARRSCASCKHQRKKCESDCLMAPYFPIHMKEEFDLVQGLFGVSNITKRLRAFNDDRLRQQIAQSLIWEARCWQSNPVDGALYEWHKIDRERMRLQEELHRYRLQNQILITSQRMNDSRESEALPTSRGYPQGNGNGIIPSNGHCINHGNVSATIRFDNNASSTPCNGHTRRQTNPVNGSMNSGNSMVTMLAGQYGSNNGNTLSSQSPCVSMVSRNIGQNGESSNHQETEIHSAVPIHFHRISGYTNNRQQFCGNSGTYASNSNTNGHIGVAANHQISHDIRRTNPMAGPVASNGTAFAQQNGGNSSVTNLHGQYGSSNYANGQSNLCPYVSSVASNGQHGEASTSTHHEMAENHQISHDIRQTNPMAGPMASNGTTFAHQNGRNSTMTNLHGQYGPSYGNGQNNQSSYVSSVRSNGQRGEASTSASAHHETAIPMFDDMEDITGWPPMNGSDNYQQSIYTIVKTRIKMGEGLAEVPDREEEEDSMENGANEAQDAHQRDA